MLWVNAQNVELSRRFKRSRKRNKNVEEKEEGQAINQAGHINRKVSEKRFLKRIVPAVHHP